VVLLTRLRLNPMSGGRLVNQVFPYDWGRQLLTAWMPCASVECMLDAALRKEKAELRRANEILKTASAFFAAAEVDRRLR
jgi:transposase-like protein